MTWETLLNTITQWALSTGIKIVIALLILFVSFRIINAIARRIEKKADDKRTDKTIMKTLAYLFKVGLKIIIVICLVGYLGIDTSGLTALTRPFKIDDYIEAQGQAGTVMDIHITNTKLLTPDNKIIYLPNGALANSDIVNYSEMDTRRVDFLFSIGYADDFEKAKRIITDICNAHELVLKDKEPFVKMKEHGASSINLVTRVWTKNADYWTVYFDITEQVKTAFDKEGIQIPFNQLDVHIKKDL